MLLMVLGGFALLVGGRFFNFEFVSPYGHFLIELFAVLVSFGIAYMSVKTFTKIGSKRVLLAGGAFFIMGILDVLHALSFSGMPQTILPIGANIHLQFWIVSRLLGGILLFAAVILKDKIIEEERRRSSLTRMFGGAIVFAVLMTVVVNLFPDQLPLLFSTETGLTGLKIGLEMLASLLYLVTAVLFFKSYTKTGNVFAYWVTIGLVMMIFSEASFTMYSSMWDTFVWLGHTFKALAFLAFLNGLFKVLNG